MKNNNRNKASSKKDIEYFKNFIISWIDEVISPEIENTEQVVNNEVGVEKQLTIKYMYEAGYSVENAAMIVFATRYSDFKFKSEQPPITPCPEFDKSSEKSPFYDPDKRKFIPPDMETLGDRIVSVVDRDLVNSPPHYKDCYNKKEIWEIEVATWGVEKYIAHCEMNAFEYRMRAGKKEGQAFEQDIKKALWYENKIKELKNEN